MNMKKLLTTTFITVFFYNWLCLCAFASENDSSERTQQTEEAANVQDQQKQKLPKTLKNRLPRWFPWVFLKLVTALAEAAPPGWEETPVPVPLPAPSTPY